jgi:hypothetical protein
MSNEDQKSNVSGNLAHDIAVAEGRFFYIDEETGNTVFTSLFLKRRGRCCGSDCRHCPYRSESGLEKVDRSNSNDS